MILLKISKYQNLLINIDIYQYQKSDKNPFIIYVDLECIIKKIDGCKNNPEIYLQQK